MQLGQKSIPSPISVAHSSHIGRLHVNVRSIGSCGSNIPSILGGCPTHRNLLIGASHSLVAMRRRQNEHKGFPNSGYINLLLTHCQSPSVHPNFCLPSTNSKHRLRFPNLQFPVWCCLSAWIYAASAFDRRHVCTLFRIWETAEIQDIFYSQPLDIRCILRGKIRIDITGWSQCAPNGYNPIKRNLSNR